MALLSLSISSWPFSIAPPAKSFPFSNAFLVAFSVLSKRGAPAFLALPTKPVADSFSLDNFSVASDGIDIDTSGNITNAGTIGSGAITSTGAVGGTDLTASDDVIVQDDVQLDSDGALLQFGEDQDVVLTHVADTALSLNMDMRYVDEKGPVWGTNQNIDSSYNETDDIFSMQTALTASQSTDYAIYTLAALSSTAPRPISNTS